MTIEHWAQLIWLAAGHECEITYIPREVVHKHTTLSNYRPPLAREVPYVHDLSKAERELGMTTTPVNEWIRTTVDWYRAHYRGENSEGYEHRETEIALATRWRAAFRKLTAEF